ncbi:hypothetical protein Calab_0992 [Caldithrix abyssi DSM 13497]|uniref:DUF362 domain-containing protein n=1 Tax=Caldithrix abyssi DSM 13497 TaxID=880073 RepID=H1XVC0_CALAY|nr:DUF362 domain-containing protein [Caldithrix abyssi]APF20919.1 protein of unknown function (DUF362) [Caldithrix abyssi DSM 13497]EHO40626.1 hypothetical protein Calab_0992 [Caldithrix abyssi DSM 13497]
MSSAITRRSFLKTGIAAGAALYLPLSAPLFSQSESRKKSTVILIRRKDLFSKTGKIQPEVVQEMLDEALLKLTGRENIHAAWTSIINKDDMVGIKSNVWRPLPTPIEVESAIKKRLLQVGVKENNVDIDDRRVLRNPIFQKATALINVRPMRTHAWSGVGSLIKNYIMFVPRPADYHPDSCADLAAIWKLPIVKDKTRLNILVMFTPLFHGMGPHHFNPRFTWRYNGLLVGFDPVAVDAVGVQIIQAKRRLYFGEDRPINPPPKHIVLAETRHALGYANPQKIELITLGWQKDLLL